MQNLVGKIVEPTLLSDNEMEWGVNSRMRMRVLNYRYMGDGCYALDVDLTDFVAYNKPFLQHNFYDKNGIPCLNVYDAGFIGTDNRETLYVEESTFDKMFNIIEE